MVIKNRNKHWFYMLLGGCVALLLVMSACVSTEPSPPNAGIFTAGGRVAGLEFKSDHKQGVTDSRGVFYFNEGDTVAFFLGGVPIGDPIQNITSEKRDFSPFDLVTATDSSVKKDAVINISNLLQSLDFDGNYENGITITKEIKAQMTGMAISFNVDNTGFEADAGVVDLFNRLNSAGIFASDRVLNSSDTAKANLFVGMIIDEDTKPPAVLINLGDDWACGTRSGFDNLDLYKQIYGYAALLAGELGVLFDIPWENPLLNYEISVDLETAEEYETWEREDATLDPYNLGVPGATAQSVLEETTGGDNMFLDLLLQPLDLDEGGNAQPITQLTAVDKLMAEHDTSLINIFTLTVGNNDMYRALLAMGDDVGETYTADLTTTGITDFLSSHDVADVEDKLTAIVNDLMAYPDSYVFISNLPDLDRIGALFDASDINNHMALSRPDCTFSNLPEGDYLGLPAFKTLGAGDTNLLGISSNCTDIDTAISQMTDGDILTSTEADLLKTRISAINTHINDNLVLPNDNVILVDVNQLFHDIEDADSDDYKKGVFTVTIDTDDEVDKPITLNTGYGGGVFSLDGLTLSISGSTLVANAFNKKIRATLESDILNLDPDGIQKLVGEDVALDVTLSGAYQIDPYRDEDEDGYIYGGSAKGPIHDYFEDLIDCDDSDEDTIASFGNSCTDQ